VESTCVVAGRRERKKGGVDGWVICIPDRFSNFQVVYSIPYRKCSRTGVRISRRRGGWCCPSVRVSEASPILPRTAVSRERKTTHLLRIAVSVASPSETTETLGSDRLLATRSSSFRWVPGVSTRYSLYLVGRPVIMAWYIRSFRSKKRSKSPKTQKNKSITPAPLIGSSHITG
jgi:hypothetical protein